MRQPMPALLLTLLVGTAAAAQPNPAAREPQQRDVFLSATPNAAAPEVYVASGVLTTLVLPAPLERDSVALEERETHFALVDVGDRILGLEPRGQWSLKTRLRLKVRLKDGTVVALSLTSHPTQVDDRVNVRRSPSEEEWRALLAQKDAQIAALQAQRGRVGLLIELGRSALLDGEGVRSRRMDVEDDGEEDQSGLHVRDVMAHRASAWALVDVKVKNLPGQDSWTPVEARLVAPGGRETTASSVWMEKTPLAPGETSRVLVPVETPFWDAGTKLRLEILDSSGTRPLTLSDVAL